MIRRIRAGTVLVGVAAAAAMVGLSAAPAFAKTTLTVKVSNGGSITASSAKTVLTDNGVSTTCASMSTTKGSTASGKIPTGTHSGAAPVKVGTVGKLAFNNCTSILGAVTITVNSLPYKVSVDSKTTSTGKTDGIISGVNTNVSLTGCSFTVTGSSPGYYNNSKHQLVMTPKLPTKPLIKAQLTVSNVVGCSTVIHNGDHPTFSGIYTVSRKIVIKST